MINIYITKELKNGKSMVVKMLLVEIEDQLLKY